MAKQTKFYRRTYNRYGKLGMRRKKKRVWRNPTGRHNKLRENRRGYTQRVSIGYKNPENTKHMIEGKKLVMANNVADLMKMGKDDMVIIANIGKKKKIEIAKKARELKLSIYNLNIDKFLKKLGK